MKVLITALLMIMVAATCAFAQSGSGITVVLEDRGAVPSSGVSRIEGVFGNSAQASVFHTGSQLEVVPDGTRISSSFGETNVSADQGDAGYVSNLRTNSDGIVVILDPESGKSSTTSGFAANGVDIESNASSHSDGANTIVISPDGNFAVAETSSFGTTNSGVTVNEGAAGVVRQVQVGNSSLNMQTEGAYGNTSGLAGSTRTEAISSLNVFDNGASAFVNQTTSTTNGILP